MPYQSKCLKLERNDLDGSVEAYRHAATTAPSRTDFEDDVGMLYMLNDDIDELDRRLEALEKEPAIRSALDRLGVPA